MREKRGSKTVRSCQAQSQTPYQRPLARGALAEAIEEKLRTVHVLPDPFGLKKSFEQKLRQFFTVLGSLERAATPP